MTLIPITFPHQNELMSQEQTETMQAQARATLEDDGWKLQTVFSNAEVGMINNWITRLPLKKAAIVSGDTAYRGDEIHWIEEDDDMGSAILRRFREWIPKLNEKYYLGIKDFEAHVAHYAAGTGYKRHLDALKHDNKRILSYVFYLNTTWKEEDGGLLRLYADSCNIDVQPKAGNGVIFLSEEIEHEVLPTNVPRWSIACWFNR